MPGPEELSREELIELARTQALLIEQQAQTIARQDALITRLVAMVNALEEENAALRERVARLERLASRNSGNSGMPQLDQQDTSALPRARPPSHNATRNRNAEGLIAYSRRSLSVAF
ncbi:hypothetical protein [Microtetraspora malaysiensis]|uniref:Transposase n=1 Tax=Microtetraspora malaysiensis TaxID=161358 RepID=A0ABW6T208_9ACTN